jgi:hypothetical protein
VTSFPNTLPWIDIGLFVLAVCGGDKLTDELTATFHHYMLLTGLTNEYSGMVLMQ